MKDKKPNKLKNLRLPPEEVMTEAFLSQPAPLRYVFEAMALVNAMVDVINTMNGYEEVKEPAPPAAPEPLPAVNPPPAPPTTTGNDNPEEKDGE